MRKSDIMIALFMFFAGSSAVAQDCSAMPKAQASANVANQTQKAPPFAPSICLPLSRHDKFNIFLHKTYSPYTFASTAFDATWAQMTGQWYEYGGGMEGWGKRFGASLADTEARSFIQTFALSSLLHQDPRYFASCKKGLVPRAWYASTRVLVAKKDDGQQTLNTAEILGTLATSALENSYYPQHDRGVGNTVGRFAGSLESDAATNLLREFWPDIKRIFKKHAPSLQPMPVWHQTYSSLARRTQGGLR